MRRFFTKNLRLCAWLVIVPRWMTGFFGILFFGLIHSVDADAMRDLCAKRLGGVTPRGFLGPVPEINAETVREASRSGIMEWNARIYVVSTEAEAREHHARLSSSNPLNSQFYILYPQNPVGAVLAEALKEVFSTLSAGGIYFFRQNDFVRLSEAQAIELFPARLVDRSQNNGECFFIAPGWCFPKVRGIMHMSDLISSSTYKKIRQSARSYLARGYQILVNRDFEKSLMMAVQQERTNGSKSRYASGSVETLAREAHRWGDALSVEVWSPEGELMGGVIVFKSGNLYNVDTLFYKDIDFSKVAYSFLLSRLYGAGIDFIDIGTLTPFTASHKGRLVSGEVFEALVGSLDASIRVNLTEAAKAFDFDAEVWNPTKLKTQKFLGK